LTLIPSVLAVTFAAVVLMGCANGLERIDRRVDRMLTETTQEIGAGQTPAHVEPGEPVPPGVYRDPADERPSTVNPPADALSFNEAAIRDAEEVMERLETYNEKPIDALQLDLPASLRYAEEHSREFRFAEEEYVLTALRLLIERHLWGPRFFNDISADFTAIGDGGLYDSSVRLVNDFQVTQRLPYGGDVSIRALATATEDLHQRVAGEHVQSAEIILAADVPLLRGAGQVARESRIQAERDMIYAARDFERFRREFLVDIATEFLTLIVLQRRIENAQISVAAFEQLERQQRALFEAGRSTPFELGEAENETLESIDALNNAHESYRLAVDRFKISLGMPIDQPVTIVEDSLGLPTPLTGIDQAVYAAMTYRLDLQTQRDVLDDAVRAVENARNALLGDLDLTASASLPTDPDRDRAGLHFDPEEMNFQAGITYGLPLDREIERLNVRQAQIGLERSYRSFDRFRDDVAVSVRASVRGIDSALFSLKIQERNVLIAEQRQASIEADPARADVRQKTDAINQVTRALNSRDGAKRDLEVAVLQYLLQTGQLRVGADGGITPLEGMRFVEPSEEDQSDTYDEPESDPDGRG
jgi:outer membrane protein TolC